jgi:hypothetical protein
MRGGGVGDNGEEDEKEASSGAPEVVRATRGRELSPSAVRDVSRFMSNSQYSTGAWVCLPMRLYCCGTLLAATCRLLLVATERDENVDMVLLARCNLGRSRWDSRGGSADGVGCWGSRGGKAAPG